MAIVQFLHVNYHNYYIPKILGGGGPQTLLVSLLKWHLHVFMNIQCILYKS